MTIGVAIALAVAAAAALVAGVRFAVRGRRPGVKLLAVPLVLAVGQWVVLPAAGAVLATVSAAARATGCPRTTSRSRRPSRRASS